MEDLPNRTKGNHLNPEAHQHTAINNKHSLEQRITDKDCRMAPARPRLEIRINSEVSHCAIKCLKDFKGMELAVDRSRLKVEIPKMSAPDMIHTFNLYFGTHRFATYCDLEKHSCLIQCRHKCRGPYPYQNRYLPYLCQPRNCKVRRQPQCFEIRQKNKNKNRVPL
ncbi:hypothetical protein ElyMa_006264300 [Elysia marginata]|uniref:Uncharacterized protein n=1 Tax=Elysia marginata TaxID=1093978 RepID=A0AAV4HE73_9GAST|nr:hypothetical protein ElyMa_006264300 [Elysia marginata]